jgi:hypothetical protein
MAFSYLTIAQIMWWLALNVNLFVLLVLEIRHPPLFLSAQPSELT